MKSFSEVIAECAYNTGYSFDFLSELVAYEVRNGSSYKDAISYICGIAYEHDF